jgi:hypothetical protein
VEEVVALPVPFVAVLVAFSWRFLLILVAEIRKKQDP